MTLTINKPLSADLTPRTSEYDHHLSAAEHLSKAVTCHKQAAKFMQGGDLHAASSQAKLAAEHTAHAEHQVTLATRKHSTVATQKE